MFENYKLMNIKNEAEYLNQLTFTDYYYRLMLMARSVFQWCGLPKGIDEKHIEKFLYSNGQCMFYKDKKYGYMVTKCNQQDSYNVYDEPTYLKPVASGGYVSEPKENYEECVLIRNNDETIPTAPTIWLFAHKLTNIERTIDINIDAQKTPVLLLGSEKQRNALKQVYRKWSGNEPVIYGDKNFGDTLNKMDVLKTDAPIVFDKLQIQKRAVWNECMTFLGVNNANMDKRERLVTNEVEANNEQIELSFEVMYKARQKACELINDMFPDLNVSVKLREFKKADIELPEDKSTTDGKEDNKTMKEGA